MAHPVRGALFALCLASLAGAAPAAFAQAPKPAITQAFTKIRGIDAVVSRPAVPGAHSHVAIVIMHDESNSLDNLQAPILASRGYVVISTNARTGPDPEDHDTDWNNVLRDVRTVMTYAKALPGITKVVLMGHSSGAPLMASYQNIAENGVKACNGPEKISKCPDDFAGFPKADGIVLLDPIWGVAAVFLNSIDPSVTDENNPQKLDPSLDSFSAANGFAKTGAHYSEAFKKKFFAAQAARNNAVVQRALEREAAIKAGKGKFADDEPFLIPGGTRYGKIYRPDLSLLQHTKTAHMLMKGDGSQVTEVIHSVRVPSGNEPVSQKLKDGALETSVNRFLHTFATRALPNYAVTEDSVTGIDWSSNYNNLPGAAPGITVPMLLIANTGHYWLVSAEMGYNLAGSKDKTIAYAEGAVHGFPPCVPCEKTPGQFGDPVGHIFNYSADWLDKRF